MWCDGSPCDFCDEYGSDYCKLICGNPCYGCPDWDETYFRCTSNGGCSTDHTSGEASI